MIIATEYDNGDKVYVVEQNRGNFNARGPLTVGKIVVEITDSPGIEGEELFNNYMPQKERKEHYMMVETGIGTGTLWPNYLVFREYDDAVMFAEMCEKEGNPWRKRT